MGASTAWWALLHHPGAVAALAAAGGVVAASRSAGRGAKHAAAGITAAALGYTLYRHTFLSVLAFMASIVVYAMSDDGPRRDLAKSAVDLAKVCGATVDDITEDALTSLRGKLPARLTAALAAGDAAAAAVMQAVGAPSSPAAAAGGVGGPSAGAPAGEVPREPSAARNEFPQPRREEAVSPPPVGAGE